MRLEWLAGRHPAPQVLDSGSDGEAQWLLTEALPGASAVGETWRARRPEAIRAIATGLRALHTIGVEDFPTAWTAEVWVGRSPASIGPPPPVDDPVLVHGDACAPNTLIHADGRWAGNVDFGDLAVGGLGDGVDEPRLELRHRAPGRALRGLRDRTPTPTGSGTTAPSGTSSPDRRPARVDQQSAAATASSRYLCQRHRMDVGSNRNRHHPAPCACPIEPPGHQLATRERHN